MRIVAYILGAIFCSIFITGSLFKLMHWPGASFMLLAGISGVILCAVLLSINQYYKNNEVTINNDDDILDI